MNIQLYFLRVRNIWKQVFEFLERRWKRNLLWTTLLIIFFGLGMWAQSAWASERPSGRVPVRETERVLSFTSRLQRDRSDWVSVTTTSTTTTTTLPKKVVVIASPSKATVPSVTVPSGDVWAKLRNCEAGGNYATNTGNGYYGAYQFSIGTWNSMGTAYARADLAPPEVQDDAARRLQARSGWGQWPACSRGLGLR